MRIIVKKWGNSASVRIPAPIMAKAEIELDQTVDVRAEDGKIVIEPVRTPLYELDDLLKEMTPDTFPETIETGPSVGEEIW